MIPNNTDRTDMDDHLQFSLTRALILHNNLGRKSDFDTWTAFLFFQFFKITKFTTRSLNITAQKLSSALDFNLQARRRNTMMLLVVTSLWILWLVRT